MPTTSTVPFPRFKLPNIGRFPHLLGRDAAIFRRFLDTPRAQQYIGFDFDIKVGIYAKDAIQNPSPDANLLAGTLAKRIDAVAFIDQNTLDLIEVKDSNIANALGQLLTYKQLFQDTYPNLTVDHLLIVTEKQDPDLQPIVQQFGLQIAIV